MKAAQIKEYGHADKVAIVEIDKPKVPAGFVLVEVDAAGLNPFDTSVREGYMAQYMPLEFPVTVGGDFAGSVAEIGEGVTNFKVGDKVYGQAPAVAGASGAFAEFASAKASQIAIAPTNIDALEAATLPVPGISALQALTEGLDLAKGQKIFIHGGSGGVGLIAVQIAKSIGAYVVASAKGHGVEVVKSLGADEVIDTAKDGMPNNLKDFDAVFDTVGGDEFAKTFDLLKPNGKAVTIASRTFEDAAKAKGVNATGQMTGVNTERLDALTKLVESDAVKPRIGHKFTLSEVKEAFTARETGTIKGKMVLSIKG